VTAYVPGTEETDTKKIILSLQQLAAGRSNAVGTVTLTISAGSTVVTDMNCAVGSTPILTPTTANAATAIATTYISAVFNGSFTITHANSTTTGCTFKYAIHG
jgi:hypothetical protein